MRIGIDCRTILNTDNGETAGVGHYTYFLVKHLLKHDGKNQYVLFFDWRKRDLAEFMQPNVTIRHFAFSQYKKFLPFTYSHMLITAMLLKERLNVFHAPANTLPLTYPKTSVITIHDLAIYKNPAWFPSQILSTKLLVPQSLKHASHIISVSHSTKQDLREIFGVSPRKITVIHEAPFVTRINVKDKNVDVIAKFRLTKPYMLFIGTIDPRKNLENLLDAFILLRKTPELQKYQLIFAGGKGYKSEQFFEALKQRSLGRSAKYLGYITHNEKIALLKNSALFVFPSLYEGFGLPVLEAMSLGVPVVTSNVSSLPEVAGGAAQLVDPNSVKDIAKGMKRVLTTPALVERMLRLGHEQADAHTWDTVAEQTLGVYRKVGRK